MGPVSRPAKTLAPKSNEITKAMAIMVFAMLFVPIMDAIAKILSTRYGISPAMTVWFRFAGQSGLLLLVILPYLGKKRLFGQLTGLNLVRGMLMGLAVTGFFVAIKYLPLADAIAIFFVEPLILMLMSAVFLGEKVGWRRILAAMFGFAGALLVIQPTYEIFGAVSLLPLLTATLFSIYLILSRKAGTTDHPFVMQFWAGIGGVIMCSLVLFAGETFGETDFLITWPQTGAIWLMLAGIVFIATSSHLLIVVAFTKAEASILAPFQYLEIIAMTILGYWLFGDFPSLVKWVGIFMIVSSGAYVFYRERLDEHIASQLP